MSAMTADELDTRLSGLVDEHRPDQRWSPFAALPSILLDHYVEGLHKAPRLTLLRHIARVFRRVALGRPPA